jgi:hypothetical protein
MTKTCGISMDDWMVNNAKTIDISKVNVAIMKHNSARGAKNTKEFPIG